jgi:uncharacterized repeat protein (TIGR03803 family)
MANLVRPWGSVSRIRLRAAGSALALVIVFLPVVVSAQSQRTQTFTTMYRFKHPRRDGAVPYGGVIKDRSGNLYGTTYYGGASGNWGAVFKLDKAGKETVVHSFYQGPNGYHPLTSLIQDGLGNFYGTTVGDYSYYGTVFRLNANGKQTVLYRFSGGLDGGDPYGKLVRDATGNLYGTTYSGGASDWGTVFKVDKNGTERVLYSFTGGADGGAPVAGLIQGKAGNLYGTSTLSGASGWGTVFEVDRTGKETVLYSFTDGADGGFIQAGLVTDSEGNMYGAADQGGDLTCNAPYGCGTVFELDKTGKETVLFAFTRVADGNAPQTTLVRDATGNLYGTTVGGGDVKCNAPSGCGTVFKLDKTGKETVLHRFTGGADGAFPNDLFRDVEGKLYGTTSSGGDPSCPYGGPPPGCGTVFKLQP